MSNKEVFHFYNNLVSIVKGMEGLYTAIDLRNESSITGRIDMVDGFMNVEMSDAVFYDARGMVWPIVLTIFCLKSQLGYLVIVSFVVGDQRYFLTFYVRARNIRYVHIPEGESAMDIINGQIHGLRRVRPQPIKNRKTTKAQKYHEETVANLANLKTS